MYIKCKLIDVLSAILVIVAISNFASCAEKISQTSQMTERMAGIKECYTTYATPQEFNECSQVKILEKVYTHMNKVKYVSNQLVGKQVVVSYTVSTEGNITAIEVVQKLSPEIDKVAREAVEKLNDLNWLAGIQSNKFIAIRYNLPIKITGVQ